MSARAHIPAKTGRQNITALPILRSLGLLLFCLLVLSPLSKAEDVGVQVNLDRDTIGMQEQALLEVIVTGSSQDLPAPQLPTLSMFEIYSQGRSSNLSITNGVVEASVTYRYLLIPGKAGTFPISNIAVVYNAKRYKGNDVTLTVIGDATTVTPKVEQQATDESGQTKDYFLEAEVDNKNPYVNQQVTLTLKFYIAVQYFGSPELTEPTTTGFWTEVLGNRAAYFQVVNNRKYRVIERTYALFPTQSGDLTIGRATIRTTVASRRRSRDPFSAFGDFFGRGTEITVRSQPIQLTARQLPQEGKPADFSGTIGQFSISASVDKREVEVNQPITVTFKLSGTGNIKAVAEPAITEADDFRVYQASSTENMTRLKDKLGGAKVYEEVFIPKRPGEFEIPSVSYTFFDPEASKYRHISTKAIKVQALKPEGYVASPDIPYSSPELTIGADARDIRFIKENMGRTSPVGQILLFTPGYLIVNSISVILFAAAFVVGHRRRKLAGDAGLARARAASRLARKRLTRARELASAEKSTEFFTEIQTALLSYIADKLNISPHGLTLESVTSLLTQKGAGKELTDMVTTLMNKANFARYAPSSVEQSDIDSSLKTAEEIMVHLEGVNLG